MGPLGDWGLDCARQGGSPCSQPVATDPRHPHTLRSQCGPTYQVRAPTKVLVVFGKMKSPRTIHVIVYTCQLIKLN